MTIVVRQFCTNLMFVHKKTSRSEKAPRGSLRFREYVLYRVSTSLERLQMCSRERNCRSTIASDYREWGLRRSIETGVESGGR